MLLFLLAAVLPLCISGQLTTPENDAAILFDAVDTNDDLVVDLEEVVVYFDQMDTDHDGAVSRHEFAIYWTGLYPELPAQAIHDLFDLLDFNGDHHLLRADFTNLYSAMDTDDDGIVAEGEFLPFWIARFYEFQTHPGK